MTEDALLAAAALLAGVLLKSLLDALGWLGQRRIERRRLLAEARRDAYAELLLAGSRYNRATERVENVSEPPTLSLSDSERAQIASNVNAANVALGSAREDLEKALLNARLLSSSEIAGSLDSIVLPGGTKAPVPLAQVFEPLRRELQA